MAAALSLLLVAGCLIGVTAAPASADTAPWAPGEPATVSADARLVTIRTYGSALEYDVPPGAPLASIWGQTPRVARLDDGPPRTEPGELLRR